MPQNAFFPALNSRSSGQPKNDAKTLFSTLHPLSPVIFATATVVAFVLLRNSRFNFHCYTQREATPTQKSARKWCCDLSRLLARKITKDIHSCKPASLNRQIALVALVHSARRHGGRARQPPQAACVSAEGLNCRRAWDSTCQHNAKDINSTQVDHLEESGVGRGNA